MLLYEIYLSRGIRGSPSDDQKPVSEDGTDIFESYHHQPYSCWTTRYPTNVEFETP